MRVFSGDKLVEANLVIDAAYEGPRTTKGAYLDPLNKLVHVSTQGGFRYRGSKDRPTLVVLTSNMSEPDWPDELDAALGRFVCYGDNRNPGRELHATNKFGNHLLRLMFDHLHSGRRNLCPPILIFTALRTKRAFVFRGLAVPGYAGVPPTQDLVAGWESARGERVPEYLSRFSIFDTPPLSMNWLKFTRKPPS